MTTSQRLFDWTVRKAEGPIGPVWLVAFWVQLLFGVWWLLSDMGEHGLRLLLGGDDADQ